MPWFHVDDGFHSHPKALATSLSARGLWVTAGSWSSAHLTDGVVPDRVLASLGGSPELAAELVAAGLWKRVRSGYAFHDWTQCNSSKEAVENERKLAAARQRRRRALVVSRRDSRVTTTVTNAVSHKTPGLPTEVLGARARVSGAAPPPANPKTKPKPPWCGVCDQDTRLTGPADAPYRCPECHPIDGRRTRI